MQREIWMFILLEVVMCTLIMCDAIEINVTTTIPTIDPAVTKSTASLTQEDHDLFKIKRENSNISDPATQFPFTKRQEIIQGREGVAEDSRNQYKHRSEASISRGTYRYSVKLRSSGPEDGISHDKRIGYSRKSGTRRQRVTNPLQDPNIDNVVTAKQATFQHNVFGVQSSYQESTVQSSHKETDQKSDTHDFEHQNTFLKNINQHLSVPFVSFSSITQHPITGHKSKNEDKHKSNNVQEINTETSNIDDYNNYISKSRISPPMPPNQYRKSDGQEGFSHEVQYNPNKYQATEEHTEKPNENQISQNTFSGKSWFKSENDGITNYVDTISKTAKDNSLVENSNAFGYKLQNSRNTIENASPIEGLDVIYNNEYENTRKPGENFKEISSGHDLKAVEGKKGFYATKNLGETEQEAASKLDITNSATKVNVNSPVLHTPNDFRPSPNEELAIRNPNLLLLPTTPTSFSLEANAMLPSEEYHEHSVHLIPTKEDNNYANTQKTVQDGGNETAFPYIFSSRPVTEGQHPTRMGFHRGAYVPHNIRSQLQPKPFIHFPNTVTYNIVTPRYQYLHPPHPNALLHNTRPLPLPIPQTEAGIIRNKHNAPTRTGRISENSFGTKPTYVVHRPADSHMKQRSKYLQDALLHLQNNFQTVLKQETSSETSTEHDSKYTLPVRAKPPTSHQFYTFIYPPRMFTQPILVGQSKIIEPIKPNNIFVEPNRFTFQPLGTVTEPHIYEYNSGKQSHSRADFNVKQLFHTSLNKNGDLIFASDRIPKVTNLEHFKGWKPILHLSEFDSRVTNDYMGKESKEPISELVTMEAPHPLAAPHHAAASENPSESTPSDFQ